MNINCFQTPPATYRRQVDLHYSSLPRQTFPAAVNLQPLTTNGTGGCITNGAQSPPPPIVDNNANPKQRNVAFGKHFQLCPSNASKSASNVYHHQLVLYQHPTAHHTMTGFQNQRGYSVPNLGFCA